jgi:NADPH:quinone reductase-like Zn-dependent oxidoreductase
MTAWHMLHRKVDIQAGQKVLIWGASSGVGSAAIQIAKAAGAWVVTTAGTDEKSAFGIKLGADHVINYRTENVGMRTLELTDGQGVDIIFEHVGLDSWPHTLKALKFGGKIVTCGATTGPVVRIDLRHLFIKRQQIIGSTMGDRKDLISLTRLIENGKITPAFSHVLKLEEIRQAHRILEQGNNLGKVVVSLSP